MTGKYGFEHYLRTGRRVADASERTEVKFKPWHDPEDGRFTFAGQGRYFGGERASSGRRGNAGARPAALEVVRMRRPASQLPKTRRATPSAARLPVIRTMGLPADGGRLPSAQRAQTVQPRPTSRKPTPRRKQREAGASSLKPIPGYPESGSASWRAANDRAFTNAANRFNSQRDLRPADDKYVDPQLIKAWAMVESGGSKTAFLRDPLQVNNTGDWTELKGRATGLKRDQRMTPAISVEAALKWLEFKGYYRDSAGRRGPWRGFEVALRRYNGNSKRHSSGVLHSIWYVSEVQKLYQQSKESP